jgi:hypothetical protein
VFWLVIFDDALNQPPSSLADKSPDEDGQVIETMVELVGIAAHPQVDTA